MRPSNRRIPRAAPPRDVLEVHAEEAGEEAPPPVAPEPPSPRASRAVSLARSALGAAMAITVSTGVAWAARRYVMTSPRFALREVVVDDPVASRAAGAPAVHGQNGARPRTRAVLLSEAGIAMGENVFSIDLDRAKKKLLEDPWIADVTLARRLPATVLLHVEEREAAAIVALGDSYLVTRDGRVFKRVELGDPSDLPVITGIDPARVSTDREGVARTVVRALDLAADYRQSPLGARLSLEEIHTGEAESMTLVVGRGAITLRLGGPPFRRKLDRAARVITELERRGEKPDTILLDNDARPERVVARVK